jgi:hypothetical protein
LAKLRKAPPARDWAGEYQKFRDEIPAWLTLQAWAWQFLRRNPVYRAEWQERRPPPEPDPDVLQAPPKPGTIPDPAATERWGLVAGYHDPDEMWPDDLRFVRSFGTVTTAAEIREGSAPPDVIDSTYLVSFDVTKDLRAQLVIARAKLRRYQIDVLRRLNKKAVGTPRQQRDLWGDYLFLLDVTAQGATSVAIAEALYWDDKVIRDRLRAAKASMQPHGRGGYLAISDLDDGATIEDTRWRRQPGDQGQA